MPSNSSDDPQDPDVIALARLCGGVGNRAMRAEVASAVHANEQRLYQIIAGVRLRSGKPRGIGRDLRERLDRAYPNWRSNEPWLSTQHPSTGVDGSTVQVAHHLSQAKPMIAPTTILWESILSQPLPARFTLVVRDESMPPMRPGWLAMFVPASTPKPSNVFLWADADGNCVIRRCVETMPGHWMAVADAPSGFAALDVAAMGLRVVAAFRGYCWDEVAD